MIRTLLLLVTLVTLGFSLSKNDEAKVEKFERQYSLEWDKYMSQEAKDRIKEYMLRADYFDLGYTAGGVMVLESRGYKNRINFNYNDGVVTSIDCGIMGSNTYYYLKFKGIKNPTMSEQVYICSELDRDERKSFLHFLNTIDHAKNINAIKKLKGTKEYYRRIWGFYNTGNYKGYSNDYHLRMIGAIRMLKKKLDITVDHFWE